MSDIPENWCSSNTGNLFLGYISHLQ